MFIYNNLTKSVSKNLLPVRVLSMHQEITVKLEPVNSPVIYNTLQLYKYIHMFFFKG